MGRASRSCLPALAALALTALPAAAAPVVLDFEGFAGPGIDGLGDFYRGGLSSNGAGPGPDYGVFQSAGPAGAGVFEVLAFPVPSGTAVLTFFPSVVVEFTLDVESGFSGTLSFEYRSGTAAPVISIFDGPAGSGTLLASGNLTDTGGSFASFSLPFVGVGRSIEFDQMFTFDTIYDDLTLDLVPEPATALLVAAGLASLGLRRRRPS